MMFFYCFIVCMCVLMCNFVSYFVCVILCIFVFLCDILLPSGVINDDDVDDDDDSRARPRRLDPPACAVTNISCFMPWSVMNCSISACWVERSTLSVPQFLSYFLDSLPFCTACRTQYECAELVIEDVHRPQRTRRCQRL